MHFVTNIFPFYIRRLFEDRYMYALVKHMAYSPSSQYVVGTSSMRVSRTEVSGGPTLATFLVDDGSADPNTTISGPPSAHFGNAI